MLTGGDKLHRRPGGNLPFGLINHYGPTENTVVATCAPVAPAHDATNAAPPIGRPIANVQAYVLDRLLRPVPVGVPGELYIGGDSLARGYRNNPVLTTEKFIPHPLSKRPGARLYKTGDLARWLTDGNLEFLGRIDHQVKIRGYRIEPGEIESLLNRHPAVRESLVLARESGRGQKQLAAYLIPNQRPAPAIKELTDFLRPRRVERSASCSRSSSCFRKRRKESCSMASRGLERPPDQSLSQRESTAERSAASVSMV